MIKDYEKARMKAYETLCNYNPPMNDILQVSGAHEVLNFGVKLVHSTNCEHERIILCGLLRIVVLLLL